jgi:hypothetical protein
MVEDKYNRVICEVRYPKKVYNVTMVPIEGVTTLCQFTDCIRNDLDPVMVAGKQYCYGHSYLVDFIEGGSWEDD